VTVPILQMPFSSTPPPLVDSGRSKRTYPNNRTVELFSPLGRPHHWLDSALSFQFFNLSFSHPRLFAVQGLSIVPRLAPFAMNPTH